MIDILQCPFCKSPFSRDWESGKSAIIKCNCGKFPIVHGILYLKKDEYKDRALVHLRNNQTTRATITLLAQRKLLLFPLIVLIFFRDFFLNFTFESFIGVLSIFSFPKSWVFYLTNRRRIPSFFLSIAASNLITNRPSRVADIGCGVGHLLPYLSSRVKSSNIFGVDTTFMNLLLARFFFAKDQTLLICCDVEVGYPFRDSSIDVITSVDTFHSIDNKTYFLKETKRVMKKSAIAAIMHTLTTPVVRDLRGISYQKLKKSIKSVGFKNFSIYSNETLWCFLNWEIPLDLNKSDDKDVLKECYALNFFVSEKKLGKPFGLKPDQHKVLKDTQIFYEWEPKLLNDFRIRTLLKKYEKFVFLSPHFDDAVLSCGNLLNLLCREKKSVKVINVFTKAAILTLTPQAKENLEKSGYKIASKLFKQKEKEDKKALSVFGIYPTNLGYIDASWRNINGKPIYPNSQVQFSGDMAKEDKSLITDIQEDVRSLISSKEKIILFAPLSIGGHVDHLIVREIAKLLKKPTIFWEDFPYNRERNLVTEFLSKDKVEVLFKLDKYLSNKKKSAIKSYPSQMKVLFPKGIIPEINESYYAADAIFL